MTHEDPRRSTMVGGRDQLAELCNCQGIDFAVEIGTDQGAYACQFLDRWRGQMLFCVDPYVKYRGMGEDRTPDMLIALNRLAKHHSRFRMLKHTSEEAVDIIKEFELPIGFVYIDGLHTQEGVAQDLELWYPIVKDGGIIAGHDYCNEQPGVCNAVNQFFADKPVQVFLTTDYNQPDSWYVHKSKEPK